MSQKAKKVNLDFDVSQVYVRNRDSKARIVINRGGTRSTKTYSLLQLWIRKSFMSENLKILVTRATFPALNLSALSDFREIIQTYDIENCFHENKTRHFFTNKQTGTQIHFIAMDNPQKIRGVKWDIVHMNEANEFTFEHFRQFILRTEAQIFFDFNPSDEQVWINTQIEQKRTDIEVIVSSYRDNPFLSDVLVEEIERLKESDPVYWQIYGCGEYGVLKNIIYTYSIISPYEYSIIPTLPFYGQDFGYRDPSVTQEIKHSGNDIYINELYYKSLVEDFTAGMIDNLNENKVHKRAYIYSDSAYPSSISRIKNAGYRRCQNAKKNIVDGISFVNSFRLFVTSNSVNTIREFNSYRRMVDKNGNTLEMPYDHDNHAMDSIRYGIYTHLSGRIKRIGVKRHK